MHVRGNEGLAKESPKNNVDNSNRAVVNNTLLLVVRKPLEEEGGLQAPFFLARTTLRLSIKSVIYIVDNLNKIGGCYDNKSRFNTQGHPCQEDFPRVVHRRALRCVSE